MWPLKKRKQRKMKTTTKKQQKGKRESGGPSEGPARHGSGALRRRPVAVAALACAPEGDGVHELSRHGTAAGPHGAGPWRWRPCGYLKPTKPTAEPARHGSGASRLRPVAVAARRVLAHRATKEAAGGDGTARQRGPEAPARDGGVTAAARRGRQGRLRGTPQPTDGPAPARPNRRPGSAHPRASGMNRPKAHRPASQQQARKRRP